MKTLVLITSQFPFGSGETFIGAEFPLLSENFDKILIVAQNASSDKERPTSDKAKVYRFNPATSLSGFLYLPFLLISNSGTIIRMFSEEVAFRKEKKYNLSLKNISFLLKKIIKALQLRKFIKKVLLREDVNESIVFYSYWLKTGAHAISMLSYRNSIKISRAHGSDIYEEKTESGYLPLLRFTALNLDAVFFISKNGMEYFEEKSGIINPRFIVSRLGVQKPIPEIESVSKSGRYTIVSCSNVIALKRIDIIIRALSLVRSEKELEWIHFGDGVLKGSLEQFAENMLQSSKIKYRFVGHVSNEELLKYYSQNHVDLFLNTSSTEGIPVSIMEAQAYSIPVIATDTGGLKEIISKDSGSLLPVNLSHEDLAREIEYYLNLTVTESEKLRVNSYNNWNSNFNAVSNYRKFITEVNRILATRK